MAVRTTDRRNSGHRRLVIRTIVTALEAVFNGDYDRDRQLQNLKITPDFPLQREDYPCIVVEYAPSLNAIAGVGHVEWFRDETGEVRLWSHRRFEGSLSFHVMALTPLDRDLMADALEEVIAFSVLDDQLSNFFYTIYGRPGDTVGLVFSQIALNSDEIQGSGGSASVAPWAPEDQLVHDTTVTCEIHGGFYNVQPQDTWSTVGSINAQSYPQFEEIVTLPFADQPGLIWSNPFLYDDEDTISGESVVSASESKV